MGHTAAEVRAITPETLAKYEAVIGLEVHVQLQTASKAFCACALRFGDPPNSNTCPVCLGLPGSLPVLNRAAVEMAVRAALALHCSIQQVSRFARKNYFYPDLPKGYQISQYELPLATGGWVEINVAGPAKRIGVTRLHMEEDAAKNLHEGFPDSADKSYIDFNRCGAPLCEIVSEPDMRSAAEAHAYLTALKQTLEYTGVSDCDMEKGSLRCDGNVSVRRRGADTFGVKTEVKNLNSFRYVARAIEYEIHRHIGVLESGGRITQETRLWNVAAGRTEPMRSKEAAHDYRYFPEPDLQPLTVSAAWCEEVRRAMPELPAAKRARFLAQYAITEYDAGVLIATRALADYFESAVAAGAPAKTVSSWMQTELLRRLNDSATDITASPVAPAALAGLLARMEKGELTAANGKKVFARMFATGRAAEDVIAEAGLGGQSGADEVERAAREVIAGHPDNVAKYRSGNEGVFKFFVGQVMRATRGQADPQTVHDVLRRLLAAP
jgi:aspartyl-tRNA(Asn)/glutamyl-tRNA(Gln) amidotransferase subunit B